MDQNLEERRKLESGINDRLGAALLLLNNTVYHEDTRDFRSDARKVIQIPILELQIRLKLGTGWGSIKHESDFGYF